MGRGSSGGSSRAKAARASKGKGGDGGAAGGGGAAPAAGPTPSQATVAFVPDYSPAQHAVFAAKFRETFGAKFTMQDFASASGAPDNAKVFVDYDAPFGAIPGRFTAYIYAPQIEEMRRTFTVDRRGQPIIKNDIFALRATGGGVGLKLFSGQVAHATALGFKAIKTSAAREAGVFNGYSTWAKFGYNAKLPAAIRAQLPAGLQGVRSMHELRKTEAGRSWWTEHGRTIDMRFNLAPNSRSQRLLKDYAAERASRPPTPR